MGELYVYLYLHALHQFFHICDDNMLLLIFITSAYIVVKAVIFHSTIEKNHRQLATKIYEKFI